MSFCTTIHVCQAIWEPRCMISQMGQSLHDESLTLGCVGFCSLGLHLHDTEGLSTHLYHRQAHILGILPGEIELAFLVAHKLLHFNAPSLLSSVHLFLSSSSVHFFQILLLSVHPVLCLRCICFTAYFFPKL